MDSLELNLKNCNNQTTSYLTLFQYLCMSICCGNYSKAHCPYWSYDAFVNILLWNGRTHLWLVCIIRRYVTIST